MRGKKISELANGKKFMSEIKERFLICDETICRTEASESAKVQIFSPQNLEAAESWTWQNSRPKEMTLQGKLVLAKNYPIWLNQILSLTISEESSSESKLLRAGNMNLLSNYPVTFTTELAASASGKINFHYVNLPINYLQSQKISGVNFTYDWLLTITEASASGTVPIDENEATGSGEVVPEATESGEVAEASESAAVDETENDGDDGNNGNTNDKESDDEHDGKENTSENDENVTATRTEIISYKVNEVQTTGSTELLETVDGAAVGETQTGERRDATVAARLAEKKLLITPPSSPIVLGAQTDNVFHWWWLWLIIIILAVGGWYCWRRRRQSKT